MKKQVMFARCMVLLLIVLCGLNTFTHGESRMETKTAFKAERISRSSIIILNAPLDRVFPLFGPIEEKKWAHGWNPQIIFSNTNTVEPYMVFKTPAHDRSKESDATWVVSRFLPNQALIEYTVFTTERIWFITIQCEEEKSNLSTRAKIIYTFTGLTEKGKVMNQKHLSRIFAHDLKDWEEAINYYLKTGKTLRHHH